MIRQFIVVDSETQSDLPPAALRKLVSDIIESDQPLELDAREVLSELEARRRPPHVEHLSLSVLSVNLDPRFIIAQTEHEETIRIECTDTGIELTMIAHPSDDPAP